MQKINSAKSLRAAILELEEKRAFEERIVREEFLIAYESIKPINLIKSTFKEVAESEDIKDELINTSIGLTVGYVSKKLFEGVSSNPIKKILGTALMFSVKSIVAKNPDMVKTLVHGAMNMIRKKLDKPHGAGLNENKYDETK